jgi:hypothetical protein
MAHANDEYLDIDGNPLKKGSHYNLVDDNNKILNVFGYLGKNGTLNYQFSGHGAVTFKYINANGFNKGLRGIRINTNPRFLLRPEIVNTDSEDEDIDIEEEDNDNDSEDDFGGGKRITKRKTLNKRKALNKRRITKKRRIIKRKTLNKRRIIKRKTTKT